MADFLMPALGADMETGKVVQWLVKPGDRVKPGDVVAVVETHKGAIDVEIFLDGVEISRAGEKKLNEVRRRFGMLFQGSALFNSMTVAPHATSMRPLLLMR